MYRRIEIMFFFYFFDKEPLKSDSKFIIKSYHDIFLKNYLEMDI